MSPSRPARVAGVDVARGLAAALMVQGHAFEAFASPAARSEAAYRIESAFLQTLALPAFLVLSGASLALRVEAAVQRGEDAPAVRRAVLRRSLMIVLAGYALSTFSALLDGWEGPETFLRADVLHVIGLSLAWLAWAGVRGRRVDGEERGIRGARLVSIAFATAIVPVLLCPLVSSIGARIPAELGWVLGLVIDVPPTTRMPMIPLVSWTAIGLLVGRWMIERNRLLRSPAGAPDRDLGRIALLSIAVAALFTAATELLVEVSGGALTRLHPAVIPNAIELGARGTLVLAAGAWIAPRLPELVRGWMIRLGRGSLWAYAFHVPICYGRPGEALRGALSLAECAAAAALLLVACFAVVRFRDALRSFAWRDPDGAGGSPGAPSG